MHDTRPIPKKTVIIISILIICGLFFYIVAQSGKITKAQKALEKVGYTNIENVKVAAVNKFQNSDTNIEGYKYTVRFTDLTTNTQCKGFIWIDFKRNIHNDFECN